MIATLIDYGAGNLHSLEKAIAIAGFTTRITDDARAALDTDLLVLPGVGAFGYAMERLAGARDDLRRAIESGLPTIGICLGMQLLYDASDEGAGPGLGVIPGRVTRIRAARLPHLGWNTVVASDGDAAPTTVYYANSFACRPRDEREVVAWTAYENDRFPAIVRRGSAVGVQFHPEKSSAGGLRLLGRLLADVTAKVAR